ncbi:MAG: enoyl-CoA hydratase-related protein [Chloroflexi bacterium]|nr:enoyl-CoA hydratase-related protein [Chloroflexota bacterium]MCI0581025.1 enoyl-CoA hydratase-related protein [Chloroflexota bacterium]MCI0646364.1 enoyl-CoA hydratase-related protein [Chloroflexota bacterium]MCI0728378.1 enoyl-CoA hydratase-related protein [Chloroflexota bacterium]
MSYETILYDAADGIAKITLNRPETLNAFNNKMTEETIDAFKQAGRDKAVRCIVITGSGRAFSSGQDLKAVQDRGEDFSIGDHLRSGYNRLILQMVQLEKPIVGAINGVAAGAGCGVALACDLRIASHKACFMQAFSRVGLIPDSGTTWLLTRLIGYSRAYQMAVTADRIPADKALEWGLVNVVAPEEQLMEIVMAWAGPLSTGPTLAYGLTKRAMIKAMNMTLEEALAYEAQLQEIAGRSHDRMEGVQAFLEKREPQFKGE